LIANPSFEKNVNELPKMRNRKGSPYEVKYFANSNDEKATQ